MKLQISCDWCGKAFERDSAAIKGKKHHFCCRQCLSDYSSKQKNPDGYSNLKDYTNIGNHFTEINKTRNPNKMTPEVRKKLREAHLGKGECKGYSKIYGKLAHRVIAARLIGRELKPEEVVHHRDGNKYNNDPNNLTVFPDQASHSKFHSEYRWFIKQLEVMEKENGQE